MDPVGPGERRGHRWWLGVVVAVALFAIARVRGEIPGYVAFHRWLDAHGVPPELRHLDHTMWIVAAALLAAWLAGGWRGVLTRLGLCSPVATGLRFALLAGLPMLLQAAWTTTGVRWDVNLLRGVLLAPFVEELFFRAVLVGIPVRVGNAPFWAVAVPAGVLFGSMHVPWSAAFTAGHLGVLTATTAGGIWYAWLLRAFAWNLWTTILLHAVMNGAWMVFAVAEDAAGGLWPNVGRGLTIALGTILALRHRRDRAARATA
jgi:hypothetical protein